MKKLFFLSLVFTVSFLSCKKEESDFNNNEQLSEVLKIRSNPFTVPQGTPFSPAEIDKLITKKMDEENTFSWQDAPLPYLWSALVHSDNVLAVGYRPLNYIHVEKNLHLLNMEEKKWKDVRDAIIELVMDGLRKKNANITLDEVLVEDDRILPILTFKFTDAEVLTSLYNLENTRYIEPLGYYPSDPRFRVMSTSGCSASTEPLNSSDWTNILPNSRVPWNYNNVNIPEAWHISQGEGIKIGVIDAGISSSQALLNGMFNDGYSNVGRTVSSGYTFGSSAFTSCTHGTSMSGLAAGPRNNQGAITGVAYKSSLHFIRGCEDVVLDKSSEKTGVKNALTQMGNMTDLQIISMSIGNPFSSSVLRDGCVYAYNKGKMLLAAAGTSFGWTSWWGVVYPAAYSQCYAVTGVKENGSTCGSCHKGSEVVFTIPMERNTNSSRNTLSLALSGNSPSYVGGSSCATATAAGIAALVWSVKPSMTREDVYTCMRNTAQFYPSRNSSLGYGNLNANAAVMMAQTY
ncbi:MAG: protease [Bacteroidetes bacterium]|nr:MAG: protease [Bacteroidota bacterium]REK05680.1 MAG: protease [Bacteroidota bacterium]REK32014.1 MAG: protease [Bacteroidota bacterium]REK50078.1 MAG: protease [Bacteroidota bacterium]